MNWETEEVIDTINNDEGLYLMAFNMDADELAECIKAGNAPQYLYDSFNAFPVSSFNDVDWDTVIEYI